MTILTEHFAATESMGDLLKRLGVPADRIRMRPMPGTATVADVVRIRDRERRLYELIDGTLVEKGMGLRESILAMAIAAALREWVLPRKLGVISGESGTMKLFPGHVRIPDVAFVSWDRFPGRRIPDEPVPHLTPDIAVEVLSKSNTKREMSRKRQDYFNAGTQLVWMVDPKTRTITVHTSPTEFTLLKHNEVLDGGDVLPGFKLPLKSFFAELPD